MSPTIHSKPNNNQEASARRLWYIFAFSGGLFCITICTLFHLVFIPNDNGYLAIIFTILPSAILSSIFKPIMLRGSKKLGKLLSDISIKKVKDYASTYAIAINTESNEVKQEAKKYRIIQLIWAFLSLYNLFSIFAILAFAILS